MSSLLAPFTGFVPSPEYAHRIVGPPNSMLSAEQKQASRHDDLSFRHVVGRGAGAHYAEAMSWLERCHALDALHPVESSVIVHRLTRGAFSATGIIADVSLDAYDAGRIKKHEATIAKTEREMLDYMQSTRIFGNAVALTHHDQPAVASLLDGHVQRSADIRFEAIDGAHHSLWVVGGDDALALCDKFSEVLYITDGHHRLAAASSLAAAEGRTNAHIPAGLFAESELTVWAYARAIKDEHVDASEVVTALQDQFVVEESSAEIPRPSRPGQIGARLDGRSFVVTIPDARVPSGSYDRLDVNLLQDLVLEPLFDLTNPRTDSRLNFIADTSDDAHDPDAFDAWFLPHATPVRDVMMVADAELAMPPKSTYFLPKLPSGLMIRTIDTD